MLRAMRFAWESDYNAARKCKQRGGSTPLINVAVLNTRGLGWKPLCYLVVHPHPKGDALSQACTNLISVSNVADASSVRIGDGGAAEVSAELARSVSVGSVSRYL